ncbi:hypothetical protein Nepgr_023540 [Nepenthes gracilis]|uniref:RING-type domain-containing protein n=1 Tax=Nepenthes gracilis TaxID=150966 RepID=A0AAD3T2A2_NEPGR|nr:hypothetical protein Nepgr_023540 [Nepenthes gracilis]
MLANINLVTTVIGFGLSVTFIVFVCTRLICGRLRFADSRQMFVMEPDLDLEQPEQRANGLEPVVVDAIPTMNFDHNAFTSMQDSQCSICLGEYQEKEVLRIMPKCGHSFHLSCIDVWLSKQSTCPVCRLPLQGSFNAKHIRSSPFGVDLPVDNTEASIHRSNWSLLRGPGNSLGNGSGQEHIESTHRQEHIAGLTSFLSHHHHPPAAIVISNALPPEDSVSSAEQMQVVDGSRGDVQNLKNSVDRTGEDEGFLHLISWASGCSGRHRHRPQSNIDWTSTSFGGFVHGSILLEVS